VLVLVQRALLSRRATDGAIEWYPPGLLIVWLTGLAAVALAILMAVLAYGEGGIAGSVQRQIDAILPIFGANRENMRPLLEAIAPIVPGMVIAAWMTVMIVNGALGQAIAVKGRRALRPAPEIAETELFRACGLAYARVFDRYDIFLPRKAVHSEFYEPARLDDRLRVAAYVGRVGTTSLTLNFDVFRGPNRSLAAAGWMVLVSVDRTHLKPRPLPAGLVDALAPHTLTPEGARALMGVPSP